MLKAVFPEDADPCPGCKKAEMKPFPKVNSELKEHDLDWIRIQMELASDLDSDTDPNPH